MSKLSKPLKPGQNPRKALARHAERGPAKYGFTTEDACRILGLSETALRERLGDREMTLPVMLQIYWELLDERGMLFTWKQIGTFLGVSEKEVRAMSRPVYRYLYEEGKEGQDARKRKRIGKEVVRPALFDPADVGSFVRFVESRKGEGAWSRFAREVKGSGMSQMARSEIESARSCEEPEPVSAASAPSSGKLDTSDGPSTGDSFGVDSDGEYYTRTSSGEKKRW
jgi:hypothetical protein